MKSFLISLFLCCLSLVIAENELKDFSAGSNIFSASVYKKILKNEEGNFLVSPFSAETVLALVHSGARHATADEIQTALHLPSPEKTETAYKLLRPIFRKIDQYALKTANKIYLKDNFNVKEEFKKTAIDVFDAEIESADFSKKNESLAIMNQWVENRTEHRIKDLITLPDLKNETSVILINALYFKGKWSSRFKRHATYGQHFYRNGKEIITVDTMHGADNKKYSENKELDAKFLELPFQGDDVTLTIVLPNKKENISSLEDHLEKVLERPQYTEPRVEVALPKFKIGTRLDFKEILKELGVKKAFSPFEADFGKLAGENTSFYIDVVVQKTFVDVNEEGVEAAAATFASGLTLFGKSIPQKKFIADHPFIFYIKVKDLVIFVGRVMDPSQ